MKSMQRVWEKRATVRSRSRLIFDHTEEGALFPITHQPIAVHPKVIERGKAIQDIILLHAMYLYSHDIACIETSIVNKGILYLTSGELLIPFDDEQKLDAFMVMTDESYHAYVAFDAIKQLKEHFSIEPLMMPKEIQISLAIKKVQCLLEPDYHKIFHLIAVCIAENTLTDEIVRMIKETNCHPFIIKSFKDHLSDEARHSNYFQQILTYIWSKLDLNTKKSLSSIIPIFIISYLSMDTSSEYFTNVLINIGFSSQEADNIISDSYDELKLSPIHPKVSNILKLFEKANMTDDVLINEFTKIGWYI